MKSEFPSETLRDGIPEKVISFHKIFEERGIPYAISGALALGYYKRARGTVDIDISVFLPPEDKGRVIEALSELFPIPDKQELLDRIDGDPKCSAYWGNTRIDVFFLATPFEASIAERTRTVPFNGTDIQIVSPEDLIVCKAALDRGKDWLDIEDICKYMGPELDSTYIEAWVRAFGEDESRVERIEKLLQEHV